MKSVAIIGAQWGDEGKGKITDFLSQKMDYVVRFQGGNNAGHTLWNNGVKTVLHAIPSGIMHKSCVSVIDHGVVLDPGSFLLELEKLDSVGLKVTPDRLKVSTECCIITSYHKMLDTLREGEGPGKIGTTKKGIGPAYEDKVARKGIRVNDLFDREKLSLRLDEMLFEKKVILKGYGVTQIPCKEKELETLLEMGKKIKPYCVNTYELFSENKDKRVLFEGAQGVLLDVDFGSYPFVTSSSTSYGAIFTGSSRAGDSLDEVIGITKAYSTRVGQGPFPTELDDSTGETLMTSGSEYGATTGRRRRCGWIDLPLLKYAAKMGRFTSLALTKVDILKSVKSLKACYAYELNNKIIDCSYPGLELEHVKPLYRSFEPIVDCFTDGSLSKEVLAYISFIEREVGVPVKFIAYGPDRSELYVRDNEKK